MNRGASFSGFLLVFGLLMLFKQATYVPIPSLMLAILGLTALGLYNLARTHEGIRTALMGLGGLVLFLPFGAFSNISLPSSPLYGIVESLRAIEFGIFKGQLAQGFVLEAIDYVTVAEKTDFLHWQYLGLLLILVLLCVLVVIYRRGKQSLWFLGILALSSLLWFTYIDLGLAFGLFFCAYASERLTEKGKGLLFGFALPLLVVFVALLATVATPIQAINEAVSKLTSEEGLFRSNLKLSEGTEGFNLGNLGLYPLDNRLGGPVKLDKDVLFKIKTDRKLYLRGRVMDIYAHNQWQARSGQSESLSLLKSMPLPSVNDSKVSYEIYDSKLNQTGFLTLLGMAKISVPNNALVPAYGGTLHFKGSSHDEALKRYSVEGSEVARDDAVSYLSLPSNYSKKVRDLTQAIIKGAKTDEEKVGRIQDYLLTHYSYALAVEMPPADQDFVEYFLTEGKQGYCVYFATAATVMTNIAGVPSRYVEGFVTYENYQRGRDQQISGERAHAWSEVYYNGLWHTLETTPSFARPSSASTGEDLLSKTDETAADLASKAHEKPEVEANVAAAQDSTWLRDLSLKIGLTLAALLLAALYIRRRFLAFFNGRAALKGESVPPEAATSRVLASRYVNLLLAGLTSHYQIKDHGTLTAEELLQQVDQLAPSLGLKGLVEILNQSLYDSIERESKGLAVLEATYWRLYREYFSPFERIIWLMRIAGKGRWRHGFYDKNTAS